jgi:hypothetical protein
MAWALLVGEVALTGFAWLFGWRQLLPIVTALEGPQVAQWLAPVLAAFTPALLIAAGYTQALLAGRIESDPPAEPAGIAEIVTEALQDALQDAAEVSVPFSDNGREKVYRVCEYSGFVARSPQAWAGHCKGAEHKRKVAETMPVLRESYS